MIRQALEEKEKLKEGKRLARKEAKGDSKNRVDENVEGEDDSINLRPMDIGSDAIANLSAKLINPKLISTKEKDGTQTADNEEEEEEAPNLVNRDMPNLKTVLDGSDVLLEVIDARDPLPFRSQCLEKEMEGKKVLLVLNKIGEPSSMTGLEFFRG